MKLYLLFVATLLSYPILAQEDATDFLRFKNGDTLHGKYLALEEGPLLQWLSNEAIDPITFETNNLRKLILNNGCAQKPITSTGLVQLNNGDRLPGNLISMGSDSVTIQTQFGGLLTIPRNTVQTILPNRHGNNVLYAGPFNDQNWEVPGTRPQPEAEKKQPSDPNNEVPADNLADDPPKPEEKKNKDTLPLLNPPAEKKPWVYGGASWFSNSNNVIRLNTELPDLVSIRFKLAWQAPFSANIAVFADFKRPNKKTRVRRVQENNDDNKPLNEELAEKPKQKPELEPEPEPEFNDIMEVGPGNHVAETFGSGYLISVRSSYSGLQRLGFDGKNRSTKNALSNSGSRLNINDLFFAEFEIRANRQKGKISLFVNGEFYSEWQDPAEPLEKTKRYFAISTEGKSRIRISDVVISEWNGMPDSALSMKTKERDVLLLANGTDRISGKILNLEEETFLIESNYGLLQIPAHEVTDIQLASNSIIEPVTSSGDEILVSLQPNGLLTLKPQQGAKNLLTGEHLILGDLTLDLRYAYLLEFDPIGSIFDNWDDEF